MGSFNKFSEPDISAMIWNRDVEGLIKASTHNRCTIRINAVWALGEIGGARVMEPLIQALKDKELGVIRSAVEAFVKIGKPAVEPLIQTLKDKKWEVRRIAVHALGEIGDTRAVEPLTQTLKDKDSGVRGGAAEALGKIGNKKCESELIE